MFWLYFNQSKHYEHLSLRHSEYQKEHLNQNSLLQQSSTTKLKTSVIPRYDKSWSRFAFVRLTKCSWNSVCHIGLQFIILLILSCRIEWCQCLPDGRATCRSVAGLTKDQLELCYKASDVATAALEGLDMAIRECQLQVQKIPNI